MTGGITFSNCRYVSQLLLNLMNCVNCERILIVSIEGPAHKYQYHFSSDCSTCPVSSWWPILFKRGRICIEVLCVVSLDLWISQWVPGTEGKLLMRYFTFQVSLVLTTQIHQFFGMALPRNLSSWRNWCTCRRWLKTPAHSSWLPINMRRLLFIVASN